MDSKTAAKRALSCLDLTNLNDDCTSQDIVELCARAQSPYGPTGAVCIWPQFVAQAKPLLAGSTVKIATVVNFPGGTDPIGDVIALTKQAVADGGDEIDMVIPWKALMEGKGDIVSPTVASVKQAAGSAQVKVILETGMLQTAELIEQASRYAIAGGADFIKTSTGKVPVNATPEAARIMMTVLADGNAHVGFKPAGGVKTLDDAILFLDMADQILGDGWATPNTFRFGASGLLDALMAELSGTSTPDASEGY